SCSRRSARRGRPVRRQCLAEAKRAYSVSHSVQESDGTTVRILSVYTSRKPPSGDKAHGRKAAILLVGVGACGRVRGPDFDCQSRGRGFKSRRARHFNRLRATARWIKNPAIGESLPTRFSAI